MLQDIRKDPGKFGAEEVRDMLIGMILVPMVVIGLGLILFFILGYTEIFGRAIGFFKVLFWIGIIVSASLLLIVRKLIMWIMRITKQTTNTVIHEVARDAPNDTPQKLP